MNRSLLKKAAIVAQSDPEVAYGMVEAAVRGEEWHKEEDLDRAFGALNRVFVEGLLAPLKKLENETDPTRIKGQLGNLVHKADEVHKLLGKLVDILPI